MIFIFFICIFLYHPFGYALELNWKGQFWVESDFIANYTLTDPTLNPTLSLSGTLDGYAVPSMQSSTTFFSTGILKLQPQIIVNDNIYLYSDLWLGYPSRPFFGTHPDYGWEQRHLLSFAHGFTPITANRYWADLITDIGVVQIGVLPMDWGLGVLWDKGDDAFSHFPSSQAGARLHLQFDTISIQTGYYLSSIGSSLGNQLTGPTLDALSTSTSHIHGINLIGQYYNKEEAIQLGVNYFVRFGQVSLYPSLENLAQPYLGLNDPTLSMSIIDLFISKKFKNFGGEIEVIPYIGGTLGSINLESFAFALKSYWNTTCWLTMNLQAGYASGQPSYAEAGLPLAHKAFYFHPGFQIANILFHYQFGNFAYPVTTNNPHAQPERLRSPYASPLHNAYYIALSPEFKPAYRWSIRPSVIWAQAAEPAIAGKNYLHAWDYKIHKNNSGQDQSRNLGIEFDLNGSFTWDENSSIILESGIFLPGKFFAYRDSAAKSVSLSPVFALAVKFKVDF